VVTKVANTAWIAASIILATAGAAAANPGQAPPRTDTRAHALLGGIGSLLRVEVGAEVARTDINGSAVQHPQGALVLAHAGPAESAGTTVRFLLGPSRAYVGLELGYSTVTSAPPFRSDVALRSEMPLAGPEGHGFTVAWPLGFQATAGRVLVGFEAAVGWRRFSLDDPGTGESVAGSVPLFEARARAGLWVTPKVSLAATVGTGLVVNDTRTASLILGFSRFPWDGDR